MKTIRYAIIGAGTMGLEHIQNILLLKNAEVVAISDAVSYTHLTLPTILRV